MWKISPSVVLGVLRQQDGQMINSVGFRILGVSLYKQGTWELKSMLGLSNAQPFERGLPIYSKYVEEPQEPSDILDVHGRTTQSPGCSAGKVTITPMFRDDVTCLYLKIYKNLQNLYDTPFIPLYSTF
jgi:hypothetical protein